MLASIKNYAALNVAAVLAIPRLFVLALKKCIVFTGRSARLEFSAFIIMSIIIGYPLDKAAGGSDIADIIATVFHWATLLPFVSLTVRRLHDFGASGWWCLIIYLPFLVAPFDMDTKTDAGLYFVIFGAIYGITLAIFIFLLMLKSGDKDNNKYGAPSQAIPQGA